MSFGFSVGDAVATSQHCFTLLKTLNAVDPSGSNNKLSKFSVELHRLQDSLPILAESLKPDEANRVLSQEQFQVPLRKALSQIRRDLLDLQEHLERSSHPRLKHMSRITQSDVTASFERISHDRQILDNLLATASLARDQEIMSSLRHLTIKSAKGLAEEHVRIQNWLAGTDQLEKHLRLTEKYGESMVGDWILTDAKYREWLHSANSFFWLSGLRMSSYPVIE